MTNEILKCRRICWPRTCRSCKAGKSSARHSSFHGYDRLPSIVDKLKSDEDATDFVIDRLYVTRGGTGQAKMGHVLNARFRHTSPEECQQILSAIVQSYKTFLGEKFQDVSKEAAELIQHAKVDLADELQKAEDEYQTFREKAPLLWKGDESTIFTA